MARLLVISSHILSIAVAKSIMLDCRWIICGVLIYLCVFLFPGVLMDRLMRLLVI